MSHYHPIRVIEGVKNFLFCTSFAYTMKSHTRGRLFGMFTTLLFHGVLVLLWHLEVLHMMTGKHINFQGYSQLQFKIISDHFKENFLVYIQLRATNHHYTLCSDKHNSCILTQYEYVII